MTVEERPLWHGFYARFGPTKQIKYLTNSIHSAGDSILVVARPRVLMFGVGYRGIFLGLLIAGEWEIVEFEEPKVEPEAEVGSLAV